MLTCLLLYKPNSSNPSIHHCLTLRFFCLANLSTFYFPKNRHDERKPESHLFLNTLATAMTTPYATPATGHTIHVFSQAFVRKLTAR